MRCCDEILEFLDPKQNENVVLLLHMLFRKHHLQYIPVSESFMQVGLKKNNRNRKLLSMKCVVVSFHLGYNLVGLSLKIKPVKKSAFNNWSNNGFLLSVTRRVCFLMICIFKNLAIASNAGVYFVLWTSILRLFVILYLLCWAVITRGRRRWEPSYA